MKHSFIYLFYSVIIATVLFHSCKAKTIQNELMFEKFSLQVQKNIDSFIHSNEQKRFGIFTIFISRKREGVVLRMNHVAKTEQIEDSEMGLPYSFEIRNNKLLLYYCGLELLNNKPYKESQLIKLYHEYYSKFEMEKNNGLYDAPELIIEMNIKNVINKKYNETYNLWFNNIVLMKKFVPPVIEENN